VVANARVMVLAHAGDVDFGAVLDGENRSSVAVVRLRLSITVTPTFIQERSPTYVRSQS
jgi:hypothetical protein